jgi:hypothetical protein
VSDTHDNTIDLTAVGDDTNGVDFSDDNTIVAARAGHDAAVVGPADLV